MKLPETITEVDCTNLVKTPPYPISFICGKEMIQKVGVYEPEYGINICLIHQSEIGDWLPDFKGLMTTFAYCVPDDSSFISFIRAISENIEKYQDTDPLKFITLKGINQI